VVVGFGSSTVEHASVTLCDSFSLLGRNGNVVVVFHRKNKVVVGTYVPTPIQ